MALNVSKRPVCLDCYVSTLTKATTPLKKATQTKKATMTMTTTTTTTTHTMTTLITTKRRSGDEEEPQSAKKQKLADEQQQQQQQQQQPEAIPPQPSNDATVGVIETAPVVAINEEEDIFAFIPELQLELEATPAPVPVPAEPKPVAPSCENLGVDYNPISLALLSSITIDDLGVIGDITSLVRQKYLFNYLTGSSTPGKGTNNRLMAIISIVEAPAVIQKVEASEIANKELANGSPLAIATSPLFEDVVESFFQDFQYQQEPATAPVTSTAEEDSFLTEHFGSTLEFGENPNNTILACDDNYDADGEDLVKSFMPLIEGLNNSEESVVLPPIVQDFCEEKYSTSSTEGQFNFQEDEEIASGSLSYQFITPNDPTPLAQFTRFEREPKSATSSVPEKRAMITPNCFLMIKQGGRNNTTFVL